MTISEELERYRYRRIVAGFAWPSVKPGFIVAVGEGLDRDFNFDAHHLWVIAEHENESVMELLKRTLEIRERYCLSIYGDATNEPMMGFLRQFNSELSRREEPTFWIQNAPFVGTPAAFEYYVHTIKEHLREDRTTLHFGENSKLPGYLWMALSPEEIKTADVSDYPAIAALGFAISYLDIYKPQQPVIEEPWFDLG